VIGIRAFIAVDFDDRLKKDIFRLQQEFRRLAVKGRWKHIDNFHLTLKFLDEISETQKLQIDAAMRKLCAARKPFRLETAEPGIFEGGDCARVLWLGLAGDMEELKSLRGEIEKALAPLGFPPEKRGFSPHITIGQDIVFDGGFGKAAEIAGKAARHGIIGVDRLILFKSEQIGNKRIYTRVSEYGFSKLSKHKDFAW
jgi:2'-5' RNA ligase